MKKLLSLLIVGVILAITNISFAAELYPGQVVSGEIGKFGLQTLINLPKGDWTVAGIAKKNGGVRPVDLILLQHSENKIKAYLHIRYVRSTGKTQGYDPAAGWVPAEHNENNICDDYYDQKSNYHNETIEKRRQNLIQEGSCVAVYVLNNIGNAMDLALENSNDEAFKMLGSYVKKNNLSYPNALLSIDHTYFTEKNLVQIYFGVNPEFKGIESRSEIYFKDSDWHKYQIDEHPEKNSFMSEAIFIGKDVLRGNLKRFPIGKSLDFYDYNNLY